MTTLDVLVLESVAGAAAPQVAALEADGHRAHRCYEPGRDGVACRAVTERHCPLDDGIDVGLVVRRGVTPNPTRSEQGVSCIVRAGVPLLEDGPSVLDPYEPYLAGRVSTDVVAACQQARLSGYGELRADIFDRFGKLLCAADVSPGDIDVTFERDGVDLKIVITGPVMPRPIRHALAVRVLDAVRADSRTHGQVDVTFGVGA